jgi:hypothetical protein
MMVDSHTILIQSIDREIQENNEVTIQLREQFEELLEDFNILVIENDELETCQRALVMTTSFS